MSGIYSAKFWIIGLIVAVCQVSPTSASGADGSGRDGDAAQGPPRQLNLVVGGFLGQSFYVEWKDDSLLYSVSGPGDETQKAANRTTYTIRPSVEVWKRFWKDLDAIHLWKWQRTYDSPRAADGTQWLITVQQQGDKGKHIRTVGSNAYPGDKDVRSVEDAMPTKTYKRYLDAVRRLIGGRDFR